MNCSIKFGIRSDAIVHYKKHHAENAVLCSICDKPICATNLSNFKLHYKKVHPNAEVPQIFNKEKNSQTDDDDNDDDDLITLRGCGQKTQWRFPPNFNQCPVKRCGEKFETRSEAIIHYKKQHAKTSIFCFICDKPLAAQSWNNFQIHYQHLHPAVKLPKIFDKYDLQKWNQTLQDETQEVRAEWNLKKKFATKTN